MDQVEPCLDYREDERGDGLQSDIQVPATFHLMEARVEKERNNNLVYKTGCSTLQCVICFPKGKHCAFIHPMGKQLSTIDMRMYPAITKPNKQNNDND